MEKIKKMSTSAALMRFRSELGDVKINSSKRVRLLERFKEEFDRVGDYDFASQNILEEIVPGLALRDDEESFKSKWNAMNNEEKMVEFDEMDAKELSTLKSEVQNMVLNEGMDPRDVAQELSREFSLSYNEVFKMAKGISGSQDIGKGLMDWLTGSSAVSRLHNVIQQDFKEGVKETEVIDSLILDASKHFDRPLSQKETDIIRMHVINEKVKMAERGLL